MVRVLKTRCVPAAVLAYALSIHPVCAQIVQQTAAIPVIDAAAAGSIGASGLILKGNDQQGLALPLSLPTALPAAAGLAVQKNIVECVRMPVSSVVGREAEDVRVLTQDVERQHDESLRFRHPGESRDPATAVNLDSGFRRNDGARNVKKSRTHSVGGFGLNAAKGLLKSITSSGKGWSSGSLSALFDGGVRLAAEESSSDFHGEQGALKTGMEKASSSSSTDFSAVPSPSARKPAPEKAHASYAPILRGVVIGIGLLALPFACSFALQPLDVSLGLYAFPMTQFVQSVDPTLGAFFYIVKMFGIFPLTVVAGIGLLIGRTLGQLLHPKDAAEWDANVRAAMRLAAPAAITAVLVIAGSVFQLPALLQAGVLVLNIAKTLILAAGEEVFYRRHIFGRMREAFERRGIPFGAALAVLLSSVVFSAAHLLTQGPTLELLLLKFLTGAVWALIYHRTGSLGASAASHAAYNLLVLFMPPALAVFYPAAGLAGWIGLAAALVLGSAFPWIVPSFRKKS